MSAVLLFAWLAGPPVLVEVRTERVEGRPAVVVVTAAPMEAVNLRREGAELIVGLAAVAPRSMVLPPPAAPVEAIRLERTATGVELRLRVAPEVPHEVRRELDRLVLLLGAAAPPPPPRPSSSADLYRALFPSSVGGSDGSDGTPQAIPPGAPENPPAPDRPPEPRRQGIGLGGFVLRPAVMFDYMDADVSVLDTPETVRDRYGQARPSLVVELPLRDGSLAVAYEARIRAYSVFEEVNGVSHRGEGHVDYPLGTAFRVRGRAHLARGILETIEVDPGREYFFGLGRYTRKQFGAGTRFEAGARYDVDVEGGVDRVSVDEDSAFFDYERRDVRAALGAEIGTGRRASVVYAFQHVPASPERPESESRLHSVAGALDGEIMPLLSGRVSFGYLWRSSPRAPPEGQRFHGLALTAQLRRDFGRSAHLDLAANRSTELSAFEENAFYVTTSFQAVLTAPLPFALALTAGGGYHVNGYRTDASALGAPRRDAIADWLVGLGRSVSRWAFVRADYRRDRRDSNVDYFDQTTHAFYVELGVGFFSEAIRR